MKGGGCYELIKDNLVTMHRYYWICSKDHLARSAELCGRCGRCCYFVIAHT